MYISQDDKDKKQHIYSPATLLGIPYMGGWPISLSTALIPHGTASYGTALTFSHANMSLLLKPI